LDYFQRRSLAVDLPCAEQPIIGREQKLKSRIKLLLVDDHPIVRHGIGNWLALQQHITIVGKPPMVSKRHARNGAVSVYERSASMCNSLR
jgi:hypothetical protein